MASGSWWKHAWILVTAVLLAACNGGHKNHGGSAQVMVVGSGLSASAIARVTVTVSRGDGPAFSAITVDLTSNGSQWSGTIGGIPPGPGRQFDAVALDAGGAVLYRGSAKADIVSGSPALVAIMLSDAEPPAAASTPVIDSITASQAVVGPGVNVTVAVTAHDPMGFALSYEWSATCGTFNRTTTPTTTWTSPVTAGSCQLSITVRSAGGGSVKSYVTIRVQTTAGGAQVIATINGSPIINSFVGAVVLGSPMQGDMTIVASDPDGDPLNYSWQSNSPTLRFDLTAPYSATTPHFTDPSPPALGVITVEVTDSRGGRTTGVFVLPPNRTFDLTCSGVADGTACDDGNACTGGDACQGGACTGTPVACPAGQACDPADGICKATTNRCAGVVCTALDQCHDVGVCDPATGACSNPAKADATPCVDGNACTLNDVCGGGVCVAGAPKGCATGQTCDPADGVCKGQVDLCAGVTCVALDQCHLVGSCDPLTGTCSNPAVSCPTGQSCDPLDGVCKSGPAPLVVATRATALDSNVTGIRNLAIDSSGNVIVAGGLYGATVVGGVTLSYQGGSDIIVTKLDPTTWTALWAKSFGEASGADQTSNGVAVTASGTVGVIGTFNGTVAIGSTISSGSSAKEFVAGLNGASGAPLWAKALDLGTGQLMTIAGDPNADAFAICGVADKAATTLVPGATRCAALTGTDPASCGTPTTCTGTTLTGLCDPAHKDIVVAMIRPSDGAVLWSRQLGGVGSQYCTALAFDDFGDLLVAGNYNGQLDLGTGAFPLVTSTTRSQLFVAKLARATGATLLASVYPNGGAGAGNTAANSLAFDLNGDVILGGSMQRQVNFGATAALQIFANGTLGSDAFVAKLSKTDLSAIWARRWGGASNDTTTGVAVGSSGQVYAVGGFSSTADVGPSACVNGTTGCTVCTAPPCAAGTTLGLVSAGASDIFVVRLDDASGETTGSARFGDAASQSAVGVLINRHLAGTAANALEIVGSFAGTLDLGNGTPVLTTPGPGIPQVFLSKFE